MSDEIGFKVIEKLNVRPSNLKIKIKLKKRSLQSSSRRRISNKK